ncbi:ATP-binding protein [Photorhabdus hainanensis]|uniref:ATP-binding protein n=1 Tax=Photorhabdus hainanensis TaxID=1004166 RepID=UPI001BD5C23C|nr:ATP-binding protein [Photorhabdus hainanensis]MBS9431879.1 ATP-binding protein [Photorhabdus hainanensis]
MNNTLHPRYIAPQLKAALADTPVVCLLGPRQVGKTTLAKSLDPGRAYLTFDDSTLLNTAKADPTGFVQSLPERVTLDEVQRVPEILPALKATIDIHRQPGRFILTGSANLLLLPGVQESLAGRVEVIYLQPLSEQEKQHSPTSLLEQLITNKISPSIKGEQILIEGVVEAVVQGGYPEPNTRSEARARQWHKQYLNAIIQRDVKDIAAIRDEDELLRLIKTLALRTGNLLNISGLAKGLGLQRETVDKYITILERLFLVRRLPAWHKNQAKRLIKAPKVHVVDSGLACALNNLRVDDWHNLSNDFGAVLESFVVQQLICQSGWSEHELHFSHYRDKDQVEVDLVIEDSRRIWGIEVKKAASIQPKDGMGLARLASLADRDWQGGILLYTGNNCLPISHIPNTFAVPMNALWGH